MGARYVSGRRFTASIAGIRWELQVGHADTARLCTPYADGSDGSSHGDEPLERIVTDAAAIEAERRRADAAVAWPDGYLESLAVLRQMAERAPVHGAVLVHAAAIACPEGAYLICAPSGTGKSTQVRFWRRAFVGDVRVVNGDKPFVRLPGSGLSAGGAPLPLVCGSPWAGKEGWHENVQVPLRGVCLLERAGAAGRFVRRLSRSETLDGLVRFAYMPRADSSALVAALDVLGAVAQAVPVVRAACDMSVEAAVMVREALRGAADAHGSQ